MTSPSESTNCPAAAQSPPVADQNDACTADPPVSRSPATEPDAATTGQRGATVGAGQPSARTPAHGLATHAVAATRVQPLTAPSASVWTKCLKANKKSKKKPSEVSIAKFIIKYLKYIGFSELVWAEGCLYGFYRTHFVEVAESDLRKLAQSLDGWRYGSKGLRLHATVRLISAAIKQMEYLLTPVGGSSGFFARKGVLVNTATACWELRADGAVIRNSHQPTQRLRHAHAVDWHPGSRTRGKLLEHYRGTVFNGDPDEKEKLMLLQEVAGAAVAGLGTWLKSQKLILLLGERASEGKSQFLWILRGLVAEAYIVSLPLHQLDDKFQAIHLRGKLLNIDAEHEQKPLNVARVKKAVTGDIMNGRMLHRDNVEFVPEALHVVACNELPTFRGKVLDSGMRRRLLPLEFTRSVPESEQVRRIGQRITEEEPEALFDWAMEGARRLVAAGRFTEPRSSKAVMRSVENSDSVRAFVADACSVRIRAEVTSEMVFAAFLRWAEVHGEKNTPQMVTFSRRLQIALEQAFGTGRLLKHPKLRSRGGKPRRGWVNLDVDPAWLTPTEVDRDVDDRYLRSFSYDDGPGAVTQEAPAPLELSAGAGDSQLVLPF